MPGMFICIGCGEGCAVGVPVGFGAGELWVFGIFMPGMFIPGKSPIGFLFAGLFCAGVPFLLDGAFRRRMPGIFIPGMVIPGILPMSCFLTVCFLRFAVFFFRDVAFALGFALLIPGILDISCCANTGTLATIRMAASISVHLTHELNLNRSTLFIVPLEGVSDQRR